MFFVSVASMAIGTRMPSFTTNGVSFSPGIRTFWQSYVATNVVSD
jgi:hypothetical protein